MKRYILLVIIAFTFTACLGFGSSKNNKSYNEVLSAFATVDNNTTAILIGKNYHYKFINAKDVSDIFTSQKLLNLSSSNLLMYLSVKEYKSSDITMRLFVHFEESKLSDVQISWFESHNFLLENRARQGGKKTEPKPEVVPTYLKLINIKGKREDKKPLSNTFSLDEVISIEVSEHIM